MTTYKIKPGKNDTMESLVKEGKYDWSNSNISMFPFEATDATGVELIHFDRSISSEDAIKEMDSKGLRPATATELLLFGVAHPEVQREFPIVALGTVARVDGYRLVACLGMSAAGRGLGLSWFDGGWREFSRFLAVRKSHLETGTLSSGSAPGTLVASENIKKGQEVVVEDGKVSVKKGPKKCKECGQVITK